MITRRDFITRLLGGAAAVSLSPLLDLAPIEAAPSALPVVGCIDRATFQFWRAHPSQLLYLSQEGPMVLWGGSHPAGASISDGYVKGLQLLIDRNDPTKTV